MDIKYEAMMVLSAFADCLSFSIITNSENYFEDIFVKNYKYYNNEKLYKFIELGGINAINLENSFVSDITLYNIATAESMLKYKGKLNKNFLKICIDDILNSFNIIVTDFNKKKKKDSKDRISNMEIFFILKEIFKNENNKNTDEFNLSYKLLINSSNPSTKSLIIGSCLSGKKNRNELIDVTIRISQITDNSPLGFLGGLTTSLFTAFSLENIPIQKWPFELLKILKSNYIRAKIDKDDFNMNRDYHMYINHWTKYIDIKFENNYKNITNNLAIRIHNYYHNFNDRPFEGIKDDYLKNFNKSIIITGKKVYKEDIDLGSSSFCCNIMAYDCLLDCQGNWEKLIIYSSLFIGKSNNVGSIASGLYGIHYGYGDVNKKILKNLEFLNKLKNLSKKIYKKFNN